MKRFAIAIAGLILLGSLSPSPAPAQERLTREALAAADYLRGRLAFQQRCSACHTLAEGALHLAGPNLWEVIGRTAGSREEFTYSETLREAGFAWTPDRVDDWLADPDGYLPGNTMLIPEPVPDRDRLPMISFMMMETGGADWPRPEIDLAALETPGGQSPAERFPSFWNHLMHNTTHYRWVDAEQEFVFDVYFNKDGSLSSDREGVDGFWHINDRDFFCYALQGLPTEPDYFVQCFPVAAMAIPRFAEQLWQTPMYGGAMLYGGILPGRPSDDAEETAQEQPRDPG